MTRETLVMLHGGGTDSRCWGAVRPLLEQSFDLLTPDLPGHGAQLAPKASSIEALAAPISDWIADRVSGSYHLLGHSMGGMVAMTVAASGPAPERLVLADTFDRPAHDLSAWSRLLALDLGARLVGRDRATLKVAEMQGLGHDGFDAELRASMHHDAALSLGGMMTAVRRFDGRKMLDRLTMPVLLLMAGGHAPTAAAGLRMEARLADARRVVMEDVGHMQMRDDPESFARHVTAFLTEPVSRSA